MKNTEEITGNWTELKCKLKQKFAVLTDSDLLMEEENKENLVDKLRTKLGKSKKELYKLIAEL